jgi:UDP-3-O-[3-hydroxymyristoyl] glucosamine N-acyltransferase
MEEYTPQLGKAILVVENPKLIFLRIINELFVAKYKAGIHPSAVIHSEAELDSSVYIGPHCIIGKCRIGAGTVIHGNCFIYDNTTIGKNVVINANTVIGSEGFGYSRNKRGEFEHFPHIGGVILEDNVDIGSNTSIDRGALGNIIIREGAKIDNLVHIAHNVVIGKHVAVIANAMIGGSVAIDDFSWIAPSVSLMNQISIGKNATAGLGAVVTKSIPDNETWAGIPARPLSEFVSIQKKLKTL